MSQRRNRPTWEARIERAKDLTGKYPFASEILLFYSQIAGFQRAVHDELQAAGNGVVPASSLHDAIDASQLLPFIPDLLLLVARAAPPMLSEAARQLQSEQQHYWKYLLAACANGHPSEVPETHLFFARTLLQTYADKIAQHFEASQANSLCPMCDGSPVVAVLRDEAHGAKRSLVCSLCLTPWDYQRIICVACGEEQFDQLPTYRADQFQHLLVQACDTCKQYIITVDLTKDGHAIPEVDELAALPLNLWAKENGYAKIQPNLFGI
jgi:FdhE protein